MNYKLIVGWLYPELMSTYGDRGNIISLTKRCQWRDIDVEVLRIDEKTEISRLPSIDLLFGGGAQDLEQEIVMQDLKGKKGDLIKKRIEDHMPALFVCGAPQLMGEYYEPSIGKRIEGLGIFDMVSKHPGPTAKRLIGNTFAEVEWNSLLNTKDQRLASRRSGPKADTIVGFENHGGRTYLGKNAKPFAKVIKGFGNNGEDGTEGVIYKNAIGCYFHGPLLPKNPHIADFLIMRTLEVKYKKEIHLATLDDALEWQAHEAIARKIKSEL